MIGRPTAAQIRTTIFPTLRPDSISRCASAIGSREKVGSSSPGAAMTVEDDHPHRSVEASGTRVMVLWPVPSLPNSPSAPEIPCVTEAAVACSLSTAAW